MRIVIDARPVENSHRFRGIGRYAASLLKELVALNPGHDLVLLTEGAESVLCDYATEANVRIARLTRPTRGNRVGWIYDWLWLRGEIASLAPDLFYSFEMTGPRGLTPYRRVLTLHDLIPLQIPPAHLQPIDAKLHYRHQLNLVRAADHVITVSTYSAAQAIKRLGLRSDQLTVVYPGAELSGVNRRVHTSLIPAEPYLLYLGTYVSHEPHKNVDFLFELLRNYARSHGYTPLHLVLVGKSGLELERLLAFATSLGVRDYVHPVGFISEEEKTALLANAYALVFPSKLEGFGLPPLEAMSAGVPVVVARAASLPEVVGDAGYVLPLSDMVAWVRALEDCGQKQVRERLQRAGQERAGQFTWRRAASATWEVLERVSSRVDS